MSSSPVIPAGNFRNIVLGLIPHAVRIQGNLLDFDAEDVDNHLIQLHRKLGNASRALNEEKAFFEALVHGYEADPILKQLLQGLDDLVLLKLCLKPDKAKQINARIVPVINDYIDFIAQIIMLNPEVLQDAVCGFYNSYNPDVPFDRKINERMDFIVENLIDAIETMLESRNATDT